MKDQQRTVSNILIWRAVAKEVRSFFTKDEAYDLEVSEDEIVLYVFTPKGMKCPHLGDCIVKFSDDTYDVVKHDKLNEIIKNAFVSRKAIKELSHEVHLNAKSSGWWDGEQRTFGELIALCHSELSEALEEHRNGHDYTEVYYTKDKQGNDKPEGIPTELADVVIRVMDLCEHYGIDLEKAIIEKHQYNQTRPYKHGGKKI